MKKRPPARGAAAKVTRADVEDLLFHEAALLDDWRLDDWLGLLTADARYEVPSNDRPDAQPEDTTSPSPTISPGSGAGSRG